MKRSISRRDDAQGKPAGKQHAAHTDGAAARSLDHSGHGLTTNMLVLGLSMALLVVGGIVGVVLDPAALARWFAHPALGERGVAMAVRSAAWMQSAVPGALLVAAGMIIVLWRSDRRSAMTDARAGSPRRGELLALVVIVLVAALVRVDRAFESLWYDEIAAFMDYEQHGPGPIVATWFSPANHPLQSLLSWCSFTALGAVNELSLRLPSLLAALLTVVATWWVARPMAGVRGALIAAAGMAIAPAAVLGSVEARGYSIMMLTGALLTGLAWRAIERERSQQSSLWWWIAYAIVAALGVWAHFTTVIVPVAHGVIAVGILLRGDVRIGLRWLTALVLSAAFTLALLSPMLPWILERRAELAALDGDEPTLWSREGLAILGTWGGAWPWWPSIWGGALAAVGIVQAWRRDARGRFTAILIALPFLLALAIPLSGSWIYARFVSFALPGAALAWGMGLDRMFDRRRTDAILMAAVVAVGWLAVLANLPPKQPLRDLLLIAAREPGPVIVVGLPDEVARFYAEPMEIDARYAQPYGTDLPSLLSDTPGARVLILYPSAMPPSVRGVLDAASLMRTHALPGWADWGAGAVELHAPRDRGVPSR
ncbi:MAG: glycosyltransferase family 39 protein [Bacteroidia bacterium]|nr:glycosyltransferase family 39 protein [Bacteroidia bacterium]